MGARLAIRQDIPAEELRRLARQETRWSGRLSAARRGQRTGRDDPRAGRPPSGHGPRQTLRDWVIRFNAEGVDGLRDRPKSGRPTWLDDGQLATFKALVLRGRSATA